MTNPPLGQLVSYRGPHVDQCLKRPEDCVREWLLRAETSRGMAQYAPNVDNVACAHASKPMANISYISKKSVPFHARASDIVDIILPRRVSCVAQRFP